jgi:hypothetical protein
LHVSKAVQAVRGQTVGDEDVGVPTVEAVHGVDELQPAHPFVRPKSSLPPHTNMGHPDCHSFFGLSCTRRGYGRTLPPSPAVAEQPYPSDAQEGQRGRLGDGGGVETLELNAFEVPFN